jgi:hypothetical protein
MSAGLPIGHGTIRRTEFPEALSSDTTDRKPARAGATFELVAESTLTRTKKTRNRRARGPVRLASVRDVDDARRRGHIRFRERFREQIGTKSLTAPGQRRHSRLVYVSGTPPSSMSVEHRRGLNNPTAAVLPHCERGLIRPPEPGQGELFRAVIHGDAKGPRRVLVGGEGIEPPTSSV